MLKVKSVELHCIFFCSWGDSLKLLDAPYTWNPNDRVLLDWKRPSFGGSTFKNRGHLGL